MVVLEIGMELQIVKALLQKGTVLFLDVEEGSLRTFPFLSTILTTPGRSTTNKRPEPSRGLTTLTGSAKPSATFSKNWIGLEDVYRLDEPSWIEHGGFMAQASAQAMDADDTNLRSWNF